MTRNIESSYHQVVETFNGRINSGNVFVSNPQKQRLQGDLVGYMYDVDVDQSCQSSAGALVFSRDRVFPFVIDPDVLADVPAWDYDAGLHKFVAEEMYQEYGLNAMSGKAVDIWRMHDGRVFAKEYGVTGLALSSIRNLTSLSRDTPRVAYGVLTPMGDYLRIDSGQAQVRYPGTHETWQTYSEL